MFFSKDTRLEICSGHGDWINAQALAHPDINWIGSEIRMDRVWQIWNKAVLSNLKNIRIIVLFKFVINFLFLGR